MAVVVDASVLTEVLLQSPSGLRAESLLTLYAGDLHVPYLADVEVASVMRVLCRSGTVSAERGMEALRDLREFPAKRWPAEFLFERIWALRTNATAYDATYLALAEVLEAEFVTMDSRVARGVKGIAHCTITTVPR